MSSEFFVTLTRKKSLFYNFVILHSQTDVAMHKFEKSFFVILPFF